ncbi:Uncharacterised protein [Mycobacteroides abscessus subsp. abscessus]|nr:Uncharacterised protein [Mycobacteroides abscessus subsp. abscessus]
MFIPLPNDHSQLGLVTTSGANRIIDRRSIFSGMAGLPQSRPCEKLQSRVAIRPTAPASLARWMRCATSSRPPSQ